MTKEEIKDSYSMRDVAAKYGFQANRLGFMSCPFHHGDRQASLKLYNKDFHCHACGANGDIFTFVQLMEDISFKEAFMILGGKYEKPSFSSYLKIGRQKKIQSELQAALALKKEEKKQICTKITAYRELLSPEEPFTDIWCHCINGLQYQIYLLENHESGWENTWSH